MKTEKTLIWIEQHTGIMTQIFIGILWTTYNLTQAIIKDLIDPT